MTFHDGTGLTASDVKFTLDRYLKLKTGWYSELQAYASSKVLSPSKIAIRLSHKYAPFVSALSRVYILNSKLVQQHLGSDDGQTWLANNDAGSGPYILDKYTPNQTAEFSSYPKYWRGWAGSHSDKVVYNFIPEAATQRAALESGQADIAMNIAKSDLPALKKNAKYKVIASNTLVQYYIFFNTANGPDEEQARATRRSPPRTTTRRTSTRSWTATASSQKGPLPKPIPCWDSGVTQPTFSLSKAKSLLQKPVTPSSTLSMEYLPVLDEEKKSFELFQSDLSQIGVTLKPHRDDVPGLLRHGQVDLDHARSRRGVRLPALPRRERSHVHQLRLVVPARQGLQLGPVLEPEGRRARAEGATADQNAQRCPLYKQAQRLVADDYVEINGSLPQYTTVISSKVKGYAYNPAHHQTENTYDISVIG